jgi:hypothetical protein
VDYLYKFAEPFFTSLFGFTARSMIAFLKVLTNRPLFLLRLSRGGKTLSILLSGILIPLLTHAAIRVDYPAERAVYQRDVTGYATITVAGSYTSPVDRIEVKAVPVYPGQGVEVNWTTLATNPQGGVFSGELRLLGGWYTLLVRGMLEGVEVDQGAVTRMGIGEVFIVSGQSNAQGIRGYSVGAPAQDDRVNYINNNLNTQSSLGDPNPPTFAHLNNSSASLSPMGQGAWCWGTLGDQLVQKYNVPVLFINTAWEGTSIANWVQSSRNQPTYNAYGGFQYPPSMPYANLAISIKYYAHTLGVRSILWMHGETDCYPLQTSQADYRNNLQFLMNQVANDVGERIIWTIARTSRTTTNNNPSGSITSQQIINAQNEILSVPFNPVHPGPQTDNLGLPRPDGVHFGTREALTQLGQAWSAVMDQNYFANITPIIPAKIPAITARCGENNTSAVLEIPAGFASYRWSNGATTRSITVNSPGNYSATVKNANGMTFVTSTVRLESVKPSTPSILPAADPKICADTEAEFTINGTNEYTWMLAGAEVGKGASWKTSESGVYTVRAKNPVGCISEVSTARTLTVLPQVSKPVVGHAGPFSLMASTDGDTITYSYKWYKNDQELPSITSNIYRVEDLAVGENGLYKVKALAHFPVGTGAQRVTCESEMSDQFLYTVSADDDIVVFPVPAKGGQIFLESRETVTGVTVTMFDLQGKDMGATVIPQIRERESVQLPAVSGVYILRIEAGGKQYLKRIVLY